MGELLEFQTSAGTCPAYLARPSSGQGPGLLVLQEWWGLVEHMKDVAERFAAAGFTTLVPDLYHGECACHADRASGLMMSLDKTKTQNDLRGAVAFLRALPESGGGKVGAVGYCMGGLLAMEAASLCPQDVGACINYYGIHPAFQPDLNQIEAPILGFFAENDGFVTPEVVKNLESELKALGKEVDFTIYAGADHAFFNDTRPEVYRADYAAASWEKSLQFLHSHLG